MTSTGTSTRSMMVSPHAASASTEALPISPVPIIDRRLNPLRELMGQPLLLILLVGPIRDRPTLSPRANYDTFNRTLHGHPLLHNPFRGRDRD